MLTHNNESMNEVLQLEEICKQFSVAIKSRLNNSHKGTFGSLGVVGGATGMFGAVVLAGMAGLKMGCGKVFCAFAGDFSLSIIPNMPELMICPVEELKSKNINAVIIGCGLDVTNNSKNILKKFLDDETIDLVIDADALNIISNETDHFYFKNQLQNRVLTPHPLEAARLLNIDVKKIQADRISSAAQISAFYHAWTVLKGHNTVISSPKGEIWINKSGNESLSTAGTGDVLAGMVGSLIAQHIPIAEAVKFGVWIHGAAADYMKKIAKISIGLTASEFIDVARLIRNRLMFMQAATD